MQKLTKYGQRGDLAWCGDRIRELEEALSAMLVTMEAMGSLFELKGLTAYENAKQLINKE